MTKPFLRGLDDSARAAVRDFLRRLEGRYDVVDAIIFGSRARGEATPESDIDLAVILRDHIPGRLDVELDMAGLGFDSLIATGELVSAIPFSQDEIEGHVEAANPRLVAAIKREGVSLFVSA